MRLIVEQYLEKPAPELLAKMTSEEARHVARLKPKGKSKKAKPAPEPEAASEEAETQ